MASNDKDEIFRLLKQLQYEQKTGELTVPSLGDVLVFLSLSFRNMIRWTAVKFGAGSSMIWYNIGKAAASPMVEPFQKLKGSANHDDLVRFMDAYATVIGWGRVNTVNFNLSNKTAVVRITNSALTRGIDKGYGCDFIRGYLSGLYEMVFETSTFCEETLCESKGAHHCEFHLRGR